MELVILKEERLISTLIIQEDVEAILTSEMAEAEREGEEYADCE